MNFIKPSILVALITFAGAAHAADDAAAKAQYESEKARCMSGTTGQTQASCLQSAGAAYDSMKAGLLANPNTDYRDNAVARCRALPVADQQDCIARVDIGVARQSVKGGGDVKETVTRESITVFPAPPAAPAAPVPPAVR